MNKFSHIKTVRDLNDEIVRLKLRKGILEDQFNLNKTELQRNLNPGYLLAEAFGVRSNSIRDNKVSGIIKSSIIAISAVKGGFTIFKRIKRLFR